MLSLHQWVILLMSFNFFSVAVSSSDEIKEEIKEPQERERDVHNCVSVYACVQYDLDEQG